MSAIIDLSDGTTAHLPSNCPHCGASFVALTKGPNNLTVLLSVPAKIWNNDLDQDVGSVLEVRCAKCDKQVAASMDLAKKHKGARDVIDAFRWMLAEAGRHPGESGWDGIAARCRSELRAIGARP
jgi:phage FluMu protein Com